MKKPNLLCDLHILEAFKKIHSGFLEILNCYVKGFLLVEYLKWANYPELKGCIQRDLLAV